MKTECIYGPSCLLSRDVNTAIVSIMEDCLQCDERICYRWKDNIKMHLKVVTDTQLCYVATNVILMYK
jgi:hypothetical protein